jgi:hypothetical protein
MNKYWLHRYRSCLQLFNYKLCSDGLIYIADKAYFTCRKWTKTLVTGSMTDNNVEGCKIHSFGRGRKVSCSEFKDKYYNVYVWITLQIGCRTFIFDQTYLPIILTNVCIQASIISSRISRTPVGSSGRLSHVQKVLMLQTADQWRSTRSTTGAALQFSKYYFRVTFFKRPIANQQYRNVQHY